MTERPWILYANDRHEDGVYPPWIESTFSTRERAEAAMRQREEREKRWQDEGSLFVQVFSIGHRSERGGVVEGVATEVTDGGEA